MNGLMLLLLALEGGNVPFSLFAWFWLVWLSQTLCPLSANTKRKMHLLERADLGPKILPIETKIIQLFLKKNYNASETRRNYLIVFKEKTIML